MMLLILTDDTTEVIERSIVCPITKAEFINLQQAPTSINSLCANGAVEHR